MKKIFIVFAIVGIFCVIWCLMSLFMEGELKEAQTAGIIMNQEVTELLVGSEE